MKHAITLLTALTVASLAPAATAVSFDLDDVSAWITVGSKTTTVVSDGGTVYTSTIGFSTTTAYVDNSHASYDGPAQYGGEYRQSVYAEAQTDNPGDWFYLRTDLGIYSRRNGPGGTTGDTGTIRLGTLFDLDEASYAIDNTSSFSIHFSGAGVTSANSAMTFFVENGGLLYVASGMDLDPSSSSQTVENLDTYSYQQVTVDATTLALTNVGSPVAASTLTDITKAGFSLEMAMTSAPGNSSPSITSYSADLCRPRARQPVADRDRPR